MDFFETIKNKGKFSDSIKDIRIYGTLLSYTSDVSSAKFFGHVVLSLVDLDSIWMYWTNDYGALITSEFVTEIPKEGMQIEIYDSELNSDVVEYIKSKFEGIEVRDGKLVDPNSSFKELCSKITSAFDELGDVRLQKVMYNQGILKETIDGLISWLEESGVKWESFFDEFDFQYAFEILVKYAEKMISIGLEEEGNDFKEYLKQKIDYVKDKLNVPEDVYNNIIRRLNRI